MIYHMNPTILLFSPTNQTRQTTGAVPPPLFRTFLLIDVVRKEISANKKPPAK